MRFRVIDGCPCPASIAPYVHLVLREAKQNAASIYRGDDPAARPILHRHGHHTQRELAHAMPAERAAWGIRGTPNPPNRSEHELRSDAVANAGPPGRPLEEWEQGIDSGDDTEASKREVEHAAERFGWRVRHPYNSAVEGHHWCFSHKPRPHSVRMRLKIIHLRATLPRR